MYILTWFSSQSSSNSVERTVNTLNIMENFAPDPPVDPTIGQNPLPDLNLDILYNYLRLEGYEERDNVDPWVLRGQMLRAFNSFHRSFYWVAFESDEPDSPARVHNIRASVLRQHPAAEAVFPSIADLEPFIQSVRDRARVVRRIIGLPDPDDEITLGVEQIWEPSSLEIGRMIQAQGIRYLFRLIGELGDDQAQLPANSPEMRIAHGLSNAFNDSAEEATLRFHHYRATALRIADRRERVRRRQEQIWDSIVENCDVDPDEICPICKDDYIEEAPVRTKLCGHIFGANCLGTWVEEHKNCPMCRRIFNIEDSTDQSDDSDDSEDSDDDVYRDLYDGWDEHVETIIHSLDV
ncbi:hypothetical protein BU16DRAFT_131657 [Lophium mytilinum]|uniref:RING-type domain-containing protein n=1 Tax=Lophium mytilinum TaxID=390894 RepID=A0A6A6QE47_9PEZI|nr:hypothetical protein BU16DRAFT_131657 [Lophium mytilinum]